MTGTSAENAHGVGAARFRGERKIGDMGLARIHCAKQTRGKKTPRCFHVMDCICFHHPSDVIRKYMDLSSSRTIPHNIIGGDDDNDDDGNRR